MIPYISPGGNNNFRLESFPRQLFVEHRQAFSFLKMVVLQRNGRFLAVYFQNATCMRF
jgi:hypothetical protein